MAMRKLKIPVGQVITSQFNRAVETGTLLGFGNVTSTVDISEGGQVVSPIENNRRAAAMKKLASTAPPAGSNAVLVSHKPNIMDAFGRDWFDVREGEASSLQAGCAKRRDENWSSACRPRTGASSHRR